MHILFVTKYFSPHIGGVEKHVFNLSQELTRKGHSVTILTSRYTLDLPKYQKLNNLKVIRFRLLKYKYIGLLFVWFQMFRKISLFLEADVIHVHDVFIWYWPMRIFLFWKKVYVTFHGWEGTYPVPSINIFIRQISSKLATKIMNIGAYLKAYYKVSPDMVIYGGVTPVHLLNKKSPKTIVFIGRLSNDSGVEIFLDALENMPGYSIVFCGDGPLRHKCGRFGKVLGFVDPRAYLEVTDICFCGGYLSVLDALNYGCIVFVACNSLIRKDIFTVAPFRKYINIISAWEQLPKALTDRRTLRLKARNGKSWVGTQTWEKVSQDYMSLWGID